jgi:hypothetical protein
VRQDIPFDYDIEVILLQISQKEEVFKDFASAQAYIFRAIGQLRAEIRQTEHQRYAFFPLILRDGKEYALTPNGDEEEITRDKAGKIKADEYRTFENVELCEKELAELRKRLFELDELSVWFENNPSIELRSVPSAWKNRDKLLSSAKINQQTKANSIEPFNWLKEKSQLVTVIHWLIDHGIIEASTRKNEMIKEHFLVKGKSIDGDLSALKFNTKDIIKNSELKSLLEDVEKD